MEQFDINLIRITINFEVDEGNGPEERRFHLPFVVLYHLYKAIHDKGVGLDTVGYIAMFGAGVTKDSLRRNNAISPENAIVSAQDIYLINLYISQLRDNNLFPDEITETSEDLLLSLSYQVLRNRHGTPDQVSQGVSHVLGRIISTDTWLQRVRRWAERQGKEPIALRKPRKTSKDRDMSLTK